MSKTLTKYGFPHGKRGIPVEDRFWEKVNKSVGCWEWNATLSVDGGYGMFHVDAKRPTMKAHRFSWETHNGPIPKGANVLHHCDNAKCVRPDHLFLGDYLDNNKNMTVKERHGRMLFTHDKVFRLRELYNRHRDHLSHRRIADWFGVSKSTISHMLTGRNWKYTGGNCERSRVGRKKRRCA